MIRKIPYPLMLLFVCLLVMGFATHAADTPKLQKLDIKAYNANGTQYINKQVFAVGKLSTDFAKGAGTIRVIASQDDANLNVEAVLKAPLPRDLAGLDTVLVMGEVTQVGPKGQVKLKNAVWQLVCRLKGKLQDGGNAYSKAVIFSLPFGSVEKALAKGKQGLTDLVTTGKIIGISGDDGGYDINVPLGKSDVMMLYKGPEGKNSSMLWMLSLDFGADTLTFNFGKSSAILNW